MTYPPAKNALEEALDKAFLESAPSDRVFDWLKERKRRSLPPATTEMLLGRDDRFIDLGLANFCPEVEALRKLFERGDTALRCVILSNHFQNHSRIGWSLAVPNPVRLFATDSDLDRFLSDSPPEELAAYLRSPGVEGGVLKRVFERKGALREILDAHWHGLVITALHNAALRTDQASEDAVMALGSLAGGSSLREVLEILNPPLCEAWGALAALPVSYAIAQALHPVAETLRFDGVPFLKGKRPDLHGKDTAEIMLNFRDQSRGRERVFLSALFEKWTPPPDEPDRVGLFFAMQQSLCAAVVYSKGTQDSADYLKDSLHPGVRAGYYRSFRPEKAADLDAALERDGTLFVENAVQNPWFHLRCTAGVVRRRMVEIADRTKTLDEDGPSSFWPMLRDRGEELEKANPTKYSSGRELRDGSDDEKEKAPDPDSIHLLQTTTLYNELPEMLRIVARAVGWSRLLLWVLVVAVGVLLFRSC